MTKRESTDIKLPRRTVDISALGEEGAHPEEALMLLSRTTAEALRTLPDDARREVTELLYELGRAAQNTAFPTIRVDLDLELHYPQNWCSVVSISGHEVRSFKHTKVEHAFALGVREAVIQATSLATRPRWDLVAEWSRALCKTCEELDELSTGMRVSDMKWAEEGEAPNRLQAPSELKPNPEADADE